MISIIAAIADNQVIGSDNQLIWHISEDLQRFKKLTTGHPVVMGRKTFESIGKVLPYRTNIIVSRNKAYHVENAITVPSVENALMLFPESEEIFIIGGGDIYRQTIGIAHRLYLTRVHQSPAGDTLFPLFDEKLFRITDYQPGSDYDFIDYQRI